MLWLVEFLTVTDHTSIIIFEALIKQHHFIKPSPTTANKYPQLIPTTPDSTTKYSFPLHPYSSSKRINCVPLSVSFLTNLPIGDGICTQRPTSKVPSGPRTKSQCSQGKSKEAGPSKHRHNHAEYGSAPLCLVSRRNALCRPRTSSLGRLGVYRNRCEAVRMSMSQGSEGAAYTSIESMC